jgi:hypothetical protein
MKHTLKREIQTLLNGDMTKQDILCVHSFNCEPGYYYFQGKKINESELQILAKGYNHTVVFTKKEN